MNNAARIAQRLEATCKALEERPGDGRLLHQLEMLREDEEIRKSFDQFTTAYTNQSKLDCFRAGWLRGKYPGRQSKG